MPPSEFEQELHKQHFACRKAFKPRGSEVLGTAADREYPCPDCRAPMTLMGRDFQAPPVRATKEWHLLELLRSFEVIFEPGHKQPATQPQSLRDVESFLTKEGFDEAVIRKRLDQIRTARQETKRPTRAEKKQQESRRSGRGG